MVAAKLKARDPNVNANNTIKADDELTLLTSAAIYGANASGKSNLVRAFAFMHHIVLSSAKESQAGEPLGTEPFRLSTDTENEPSFFETIFVIAGTQYRYGFQINNARVVSEWLFSVPSTKEATLFIREGDEIKPSSKYFKEGKDLEKKTRPNALFLSVVAQFNGEISSSILKWFRRVAIVSGLDDAFYRTYTINQVIDGKHKDEIIQFVKSLDINISDIEGLKLDKSQLQFPAEMSEEIRTLLIKGMQDRDLLTVRTIHPKLNENGERVGNVTFDMDANESHGTQKAFYLASPIMDVLSQGRVLIIDEMEARLHPLVTRELIRLFNSIETNPHHAQIIFTTHDTNLLSNKLFRRDQIWFMEKDKACGSHLYSLAEIKIDDEKVRNDASYEDDYLKGRYGAIPFLGGVKKIDLEGSAEGDQN
jgi:AAA15 family ATPase/GTPase